MPDDTTTRIALRLPAADEPDRPEAPVTFKGALAIKGGVADVGVELPFRLAGGPTAPGGTLVLNPGDFFVNENAVNGTAVGTMQGAPAGGAYAITAGNSTGTFAIDAVTGTITVIDAPDLLTNDAFVLTISYTLGGASVTSGANVTVLPGNPLGDTTMQIAQKVAYLGGTSNGDVVGTFEPDPEFSLAISYSIQSGNTGSAFSISGDALLVADVDELAAPGTFNLVVRATWSGGIQDFDCTVEVLPVWQPTDEATLACWALMESTVDLVMSGPSVTQATDKSGDGNHFTPKSGTPAPVFESNVWNGRGMINDPVGGASGCRFGALTVQNIGPTHPHTGGLVMQVPTDLSVNQQAVSYNDGVVPGNGFILVSPTNDLGLYAGTTLKFLTAATFPRNCILVWEDDGAGKINLWLDGTQVLVDGATTSPESTTARLNVTISLFGQYNGGVGFQGKHGEFVTFPGAVSRTRTLNLVNHLNRWKTPLGEAPANEPPFIAPQQFQHAEGLPNGTAVYSVLANDPEGGALSYQIVGGNTDGAYSIGLTDSIIRVADTADISAGSRVLTVRVTDDGGLSTDAAITAICTDPVSVTDGVFADPVNGNDANDGLTEATAVRTLSALRGKVRANPGKKGYLRAGRFLMTAAVDFDANDAGDTYRNYPGEEPSISGGALATGRETIGNASDDLVWFTSPAGVRHLHLELRRPGEAPVPLKPTLYRPAGYAASNYAGTYPLTKTWREGWILLNAGTTVNHWQGTIAEAAIASHLAGLGLPSDGQVWGVYCAAPSTKPLEYFWYTVGLQSVSGTQINFRTNDQFSGPDFASTHEVLTRRIHTRCRCRLYGFEAWITHAEESDAWAYAPNCGTLTFDGLVGGQSFAPGTKINGQNSGATGIVLAVTVSGTTGQLWLSRVTGTWANNEPIRLGTTVKATVDGTLTSKGNRIVVRADNAGSADLVYPTRSRLINITAGAPDMIWDGIRFCNGSQFKPLFTTGNNANEKGQMIDVRAHRTTIRNCEFSCAGMGILIDTVNDCVIDNNGFSGVDGPGLLIRGGTRHTIIHNWFGDEAGGPSFPGDGCTPIHVSSNASFLKIQYNYFDQIDSGAIVGYGWGIGCIIELNTFYRCNRNSGDSQSCIYASSPKTSGGVLTGSNRCVFRRNYCHGGGGLHTGNSTTAMTWKGGDVNQCYLDDGASYWDVYENVFVSTGEDLASIGCFHGHSWADKPVDSLKCRNNFFLMTDKMDQNLDANIEYAATCLQNQGGPITNMENWGNIYINAPQATRFGGYYAVKSSGSASYTLKGWNVTKNHHGSAGPLGPTGDIDDPAWAIVVSESVADAPYSCNPTLAAGTAQQLKQARGVGLGIGWPANDIPWAEMQKAGRRA